MLYEDGEALIYASKTSIIISEMVEIQYFLISEATWYILNGVWDNSLNQNFGIQ